MDELRIFIELASDEVYGSEQYADDECVDFEQGVTI